MVRLREEHGWLAMHDRGSLPDHPVAIYPPGREDRPIPVETTLFEPWLANKNNIEFVRYETFKGAYLLALNDSSFKGSDHRALWWLYPDGKVEPILLRRHDGDWKHFLSARMVPTRNGLLAVRGASKGVDRSGLYREISQTQTRLEMIDRGWIADAPVVSPDGCKLAYGIHPKGFGNWPAVYRLHVVDVCAPRKR